jgi:predicted methyltransferase
MAAGTAEKAFADASSAASEAPASRHRTAPAVRSYRSAAADGYVQEAFVKQRPPRRAYLQAASEINANPDDNSPGPSVDRRQRLLTAPLGSPPDPTLDTARSARS